MKYLRILFSAAALLLAASCIENDLPYPTIELSIRSIEGEGFTVTGISLVNRTVTLTLDEKTDIRKVTIDKAEFDVATSNPMMTDKEKFISQIMTSKSPVRSAEDVDETALNYAEIKALASGNPLIKDKMNLDIEVSKLKMLKSTFLNQRYALEDKIIKYFPVEIAETKERLAAYCEDIKTVKENTRPNVDGFTPMELKGTVYSDKKAAGTELLSICACKVNADRESIGSYKGLRLDLEFDKFSRTFALGMEGKQRYKVELGSDVFGNIQRMDNFLEALPVRENNCKQKLEELEKQLETAKVEVKKEFEKEDELAEKSKRLEELNVLLNEDNKKNDTQEVSTEKIEKKNQEWER